MFDLDAASRDSEWIKRIPFRPIAIFGLFAILGLFALSPFLSTNGDNASYVVLAQSLVQGKGYVNTIYPGDPPEAQYPPLLPVLLTPFIAVFGMNFLILKLVPLCFGIGSLIAVYHLFKIQEGDDRAWIITLLTALSASYLSISTTVLTETLYLFLASLTLLKVYQLEKGESPFWGPIGVGLLIGATFYARTVGITLALSVPLYLAIKKHRRAALLVAGVSGFLIALWFLRSFLVANTYFTQLLEQRNVASNTSGSWLWLFRIGHNLPRYAAKVMADLLGGPAIQRIDPYSPVKVFLSLFFSSWFILGFLSRLRQGFTLVNLYLVCYLGIYAVWPYHDARFMLPILPFVFLYILQGVDGVTSRIPVNRRACIQGMVVLLALIGSITTAHHIYRNQTQYYTPETAHYRDAAIWIGRNTPQNALIFARKPRIVALWSGRKAWWYSAPPNLPSFSEDNAPSPPTYLLINDFPIAGENIAPIFRQTLLSNPDQYILVFETEPPVVSVYQTRLPPGN